MLIYNDKNRNTYEIVQDPRMREEGALNQLYGLGFNIFRDGQRVFRGYIEASFEFLQYIKDEKKISKENKLIEMGLLKVYIAIEKRELKDAHWKFLLESKPILYKTVVQELKNEHELARAYLVKNSAQNKFIVLGGHRFEIANTATREAMGFSATDFILNEGLISRVDPGEPNIDFTSRKNKILQLKGSSEKYLMAESPVHEKKKVPDDATLHALGLDKSEVAVVDMETFYQIPLGNPLVSVLEWPPRSGTASFQNMQLPVTHEQTHDVFVCHASEDKTFVRDLCQELKNRKLRVWFDEFELTPGDSLRGSIDRGLRSSKYGIVVLSPSFFSKNWPQKELDGLVARETTGYKIIIPILHNMTIQELGTHSPTLAGRLGIKSELEISQIADQIVTVIKSKPKKLY